MNGPWGTRRMRALLSAFVVGGSLACATDETDREAGARGGDLEGEGRLTPPTLAVSGWSLETAEVVFASDAEGDIELFLSRGRDATSWKQLTDTPGVNRAPGWAPSGDWLAFLSERVAGAGSSVFDILGISPVGTATEVGPETEVTGVWPEPVLIAESVADDGALAVSPDGTLVAFYSRRSEASVPDGALGHLWIAELPTSSGAPGEISRVTREPLSTGSGASWHTGGEDLFISRGIGGSGPRDIVMISIDGSRERTLVSDGRANEDPQASPDGQFLAYTARGTEATEVMVARVDGSGARPVATGPFRVTGWTPDQAWLVADRVEGGRTEVFLLPLAGEGGPEPLFEGAPPSSGASFRPPRSGAGSPAPGSGEDTPAPAG